MTLSGAPLSNDAGLTHLAEKGIKIDSVSYTGEPSDRQGELLIFR
jgi:hypothetical protein